MFPSPTEVLGSVVATAATVGVFASSYRLASGQRTRPALALLAASLVYVAVQFVALALNAKMVHQIASPLDGEPPRLEYEWKDTSAEQVTERTRVLAASHYVDLGRIVDYIALDGKRTPYVPTPEKIQLREQLQTLRLTLTHQQDNLREWRYFLISSTLTALVLGLAIGRRKRRPEGDA